jgi:predicted membrane protein
MTFLHFKRMHLGSVSLAFMWICKMISYYSFKWNSALESSHGVWVFFSSSFLVPFYEITWIFRICLFG